uniref:Immunoglobulin subtype domain-containing protein n=1 Tax=Bos taurus TaxID=9913 RepID=A0AAA9TP68_BOVIN
MQVSSNLMLITSNTGETASFPCDLTQGATYIHLYKHEEGMAPRRLLYYDSYNSKAVLESGISGTKYHVYKGTGRRYTFTIVNLQASDSGIYYCAIWDKPPSPVYRQAVWQAAYSQLSQKLVEFILFSL